MNQTETQLYSCNILQAFQSAGYRSECGHRRVSSVQMGGADFHVEFVRVRDGEDDMFEPGPEASEEVHDVFLIMQEFYDGNYECLRFPGHEGAWVMFMHPFCQ